MHGAQKSSSAAAGTLVIDKEFADVPPPYPGF